LSLYFLLVVFNNLTDYKTNFTFVQHVMSMDSIPFDPAVKWRAITNPVLHHATYCVIILWELAAGILCSLGLVLLVRDQPWRSREDRSIAVLRAGLWTGLLLWFLPFIVIGGEWFLMWESATWSGELSAFRMFTINACILIFTEIFVANRQIG
jgi:predicted small integral membrane protein